MKSLLCVVVVAMGVMLAAWLFQGAGWPTRRLVRPVPTPAAPDTGQGRDPRRHANLRNTSAARDPAPVARYHPPSGNESRSPGATPAPGKGNGVAAVAQQADSDGVQESASVATADLPCLLHDMVHAKGPPDPERFEELMRQWTESAPRTAATWAQALDPGPLRRAALEQVAMVWAASDLPAALKWVDQLAEHEDADAVIRILAYEAVLSQPVEALERAAELPQTEARDHLLIYGTSQWAESEPGRALDWARRTALEPLRSELLAAIATVWAATDPQGAATLVADSIQAGRTRARAAVAVVQRWGQQAPAEVAEWVLQFTDPALQADAVACLVDVWASKDPSVCRDWVNALPEGPLRDAGQTAYSKPRPTAAGTDP